MTHVYELTCKSQTVCFTVYELTGKSQTVWFQINVLSFLYCYILFYVYYMLCFVKGSPLLVI